MKWRPAAWDEGGVLHPVGWSCGRYAAGSQQQEDQVRVGQRALQLLVDELFSECHLLFRVPALSVPTDDALLRGRDGGEWDAISASKLLARYTHWFYLLIISQEFLYNVHIHVTDSVVEAENTQTGTRQQLWTSGITYGRNYPFYVLLTCSVHGRGCASVHLFKEKKREALSRGSDLILGVSRYNSLYISSMWMWSAWESFMVTCSSILLSPRMKPSCRKVRQKQTVILMTVSIKKERFRFHSQCIWLFHKLYVYYIYIITFLQMDVD